MIYLLDTNIISETIKPLPNPKVISWLKNVRNEHLSISVLTLGEIRKGIELNKDKKRKNKLTKWLEIELMDWFDNRMITIDSKVADKWSYLTAIIPTLPVIDGLIAASAIVNNLKLVTRNIKDFSKIDILEVINPWE
jgi:predicted nucleic acid-binding protein